MNALIENTLNILSKISLSNTGYLLQISDQSCKVLKHWGCNKEDFELLNDVLFNLQNTVGIDTDNIAGLPAVNNLLMKFPAPHIYIKEIINYSERNQIIYLLLFFENLNHFTNECKDKVVSVLSILSHQVREWLNDNFYNQEIQQPPELISAEQRVSFEEYLKTFKVLIESFNDLILLLDNSGKIIFVNKKCQEILEYSSEELKEKHFVDFVEPEDITTVSSVINQALTDNTPAKLKARLSSKYQNILLFEITFRKIISGNEVFEMLVIARDLTEQWKYESELKLLKPKLVELNRLLNIERARSKPQKDLMEELNRLKTEFISNISHEFRTTLASIIGFSEIIETDSNLPEELRMQFNHLITSEGKRLAKLITDVLEAPKIEDGKITLNKTVFDAVNLVQEVVNTNIESASAKKIILTFDQPSEKILIEADKENIFRAINALVNNAVKFTGEFGRVKVIVNNLFKEVEIIISDTGVGIPSGDLPYIFQQFYKVSRLRSDIESIGVGLVFVKQIIDLHKGLIAVQSEIGSGTTFVVKLPKTGKNE
ncbi:MAG: PAS domain-containing sensor histidine kinase [Ignavibacteriaceae bacterium]|nr:PAS domain-containing sensor histidine kinase [Ignavibacteriaceae bacterium]